MPEESSTVGRLKRRGWRILLGVVAAVAVIMLVMIPELAAMGFLFDPVLLDVAIVLFGTQLLLFRGASPVIFCRHTFSAHAPFQGGQTETLNV